MTAEILASIPAALASYEACRERAVAFILAQVGDDGAITCAAGPRVTFYRVPWALAVSGETAAGSRVLGWVEAAAMDADGHFHGGLALTSDANATTAGYAETCLAYGATLLRRFDLACMSCQPDLERIAWPCGRGRWQRTRPWWALR